ncbi:hypothetical protein ACMA1D_23505, partial [Streptomyces sp. 796.1]
PGPGGHRPAPRDPDAERAAAARAADRAAERAAERAAAEAARSAHAADRRALVEQTDHAEWVDDRERERGGVTGASWDPVPVPLPTYVTAPVAPRASGNADLGGPDGWSPTRSSAAGPTDGPPAETAVDPIDPADPAGTTPRAPGRDRGRTPLFDQYADDPHPRAANE